MLEAAALSRAPEWYLAFLNLVFAMAFGLASSLKLGLGEVWKPG